MKKILLLLTAAFYSFVAISQVYTPQYATVYGQHSLRMKVDSVQHIPVIEDLLLHTVDNSPQVRVYGGRLIFYQTSWKQMLDMRDTGRGTSNIVTGGSLKKVIDSALAVISSGYQPLNSNLTAISALTTTTFGRSLLTEASSTTLKTTLGATTVGNNFFTLTNPSAITFPRINADNTISALDAATFRTAIGAGTGAGTVSTVSVVSANGFAGTVATATTTPAITLTTSITGLLKGNGTAISAAVAGTDYLVNNQTISFAPTGDVTGSTTGSTTLAPVLAIGANKVTLAQMAQIATQTFLARTTVGTGNVEALTVAQVKTLLNLAGSNTGDQTITLTGDVTGSGTGSFATTIGALKVTNAMLAGSIDLTTKVTGLLPNANLANSSITVGSTNIVLGTTSTTLAGLTSVSTAALAVTANATIGGTLTVTSVTSLNGVLNANNQIISSITIPSDYGYKFENVSSTGIGTLIRGGTGANPALRVQDYLAATIADFRGNGIDLIKNTAITGTLTVSSTITNAGLAAGSAGNFIVSNSNVLVTRTAAQVLSDIGAAASTINLQSVLTNGSTLTAASNTITTSTHDLTVSATTGLISLVATTQDITISSGLFTNISGTSGVKVSGTLILQSLTTDTDDVSVLTESNTQPGYIQKRAISNILSGYLTTATAASTYLPLAGGTMTGAVLSTKNANFLSVTPTTATSNSFMTMTNTGGNYYLGIENNTGGSIAIGSTAYALVLTTESARPLQIATGNNVRSTWSSAGVLTHSSTMQITGSSGPTSGVGLELLYNGTSIIQSYNRNTSAYGNLELDGSTITFGTGASATTALTINSSQQVAIGSGSVSNMPTPSLLQVSLDNSSAGTYLAGAVRINQSVATTSAQAFEGYTKISHTSGTVSTAFATIGNIEVTGSAAITEAIPMNGGGVLSGTSTIAVMRVFKSSYAVTAAGTISDYYGFYAKAPTTSGGGVITNKYSFFGESGAGIASIADGVTSASYTATGGGGVFGTSNLGTTQGYTFITNTGGTYYSGVDNSTGSIFGFGAYGYNIYLPASKQFTISQGGVAALTINSSQQSNFKSAGSGSFASTVRIENTTSGNAVLEFGNTANSAAIGYGNGGAFSKIYFVNGALAEIANINLSTGAYTALSDSTKKKNIVNAGAALTDLMKIKIRAYDWKENSTHEKYGVVAQELKLIAPEYVQSMNNNLLGVSKAEMVPMLIKAIQELKNEVDSLKNVKGIANKVAYKQQSLIQSKQEVSLATSAFKLFSTMFL